MWGWGYPAAPLGRSTNFSIVDKLLRSSPKKALQPRCQINPEAQLCTSVLSDPSDPCMTSTFVRQLKPSISFSLGSSAGEEVG